MADNAFVKNLYQNIKTNNAKAGYSGPGSSGVAETILSHVVNSKPAINSSLGGGHLSSGGGGGSSSSGSSSSNISASGGGFDYAGYLNQLMAEKRAAAENAYNNAVNRINDAYNRASSNYANIYNNGVNTLKGSYNNSQNKINEQASDSMQEAYVNKMLSQKNLSQQLAAMGMSGGASESAAAGLINNYGNARNGIQKTWNSNLADLENTFQNNLNNLYSAYQSQMAALDNQRASALSSAEQNLAGLITDSYGGLANALLSNPSILKNMLESSVTSQANYVAPEATAATNTYNPVNTQQVNDMGGNLTNYQAVLKAQLDQLNDSAKQQKLLSMGYTPQQTVDLLNSYYAS